MIINLECTNLIRFVDSQLWLMMWLKKIEEQLAKAAKAKIDRTNRLTNKIQKKLCKLRKENKFTNKTYFELYPSDRIPPRLYGTIKLHKPEKKNLPMSVIVSAIGTPSYGI